MKVLERILEEAILQEFKTIESLGGVLGAVENRYQRTQIQAGAHRMERQIHSGARPLIGLTRYGSAEEPGREVVLVKTPTAKKRLQLSRLKEFKRRHTAKAQRALDRLGAVVDGGGNIFEELLKTVEICSLGQITERLQQHAGKFRPLV
jgi:methylmalonyl-CoA mutase N-terminal domain/subunit